MFSIPDDILKCKNIRNGNPFELFAKIINFAVKLSTDHNKGRIESHKNLQNYATVRRTIHQSAYGFRIQADIRHGA
jgi:hypothetical protein